MVVEMLKKRYAPCEPIVLNDMKWLKLGPDAKRQMFKRLSDKGILNRYINGVYYFPGKEREPSLEKVLKRMYLEDDKESYGYYAGCLLGKKIGVTKKVDEYPIIVTNKENSRGRFRQIGEKKVYLRKPYIKINRDNVKAAAVLDFIREWELYSDLSEESTFSYIRKYMKKEKISRQIFNEVAIGYPSRVSAMILKYGLM